MALSFMVPAVGQARVLGVLQDRQPHGPGRPQSLAHNAVFQQGTAIVAEGHRARGGQRREVGQPLALAGHGSRGHRKHVDHGAALGLLQPARDGRQIVDGRGVGHGADGGKAARRRRRRPAGNGLLLPLSRLPQMHVQVDEPGSHHQTGRVENLFGATFGNLADLGHFAVPQQHVRLGVQFLCGIDHASTANEE